MIAPLQCLECGTPIDSADTGGLCPKCLLKLGLANSTFGFTDQGLPGREGEMLEFGSCRIVRVLGKGGMGTVYEAEQRDSGRRVALKVLGQTLDTPELRSRFLREGQLAAAVRHPHVVGVISAEEVEGTPVIAMELLHDGTLAEKVKREGPMPIPAAINAVLQIIDGLSAAHAVGVLHRDVKPANCFISADGMVKVGDFGLSISTMGSLEKSLTQSGAVLGTPAFAAPEQLRGEDLDARADIYSVGATLYYLLTGKSTHDADSLVALIAAVLTKRPADPRTLRKDIPPALARVVMKCLERNKGQRYASYASLRDALEPFLIETAQPAMLGLRFVAGCVDSFLATMLSSALEFRSNNTEWPLDSSWPSFYRWLAAALVSILYFTILEGRWGTTPGKMLCGLRVAAKKGGYPGFARALWRSLIFRAPALLPVLLLGTWIGGRGESASDYLGILTGLLGLLLYVTMRRANGLAAVHDLLSGTRVVALPSRDESTLLSATGTSLEPPPADAAKLGPFQVIRRSGRVVDAWDPVLKRAVWVVECPPGSSPLAEPRRNLNRPGRLRWLQGIRSPQENWDAYEAPAGVPLAQLSNGLQPWGHVRRWMLDLTREFASSSRAGTRPSLISFQRVWITLTGQAVWLDFPLTESDDAFPMQDHHALQRFLSLLGAACLVNDPPLHATRLIETLSRERLDSVQMITGNLSAVMTFPAGINRRRRLVTLAVWPLMVLATATLLGATFQPMVETELNHSRPPTVSVGIDATTTTTPTTPVAASVSSSDPEVDLLLQKPTTRLIVALWFSTAVLLLGSFISFIWTLATGVPPGLHLYGLVLMTRARRPAPRWLAALRSMIVALVPGIFCCATLAVSFLILEPEVATVSIFVSGVCFLLLLGIAIQAYLMPQRALVDLVLGTAIVPR